MSDSLIIKVLNEDGEKIELQLIDSLVVDGQKYVLLAPVGEEDDAYVYKAISLGDNKESYEYIEDDEEFNKVLDAYEALEYEEEDEE